LAIAEQRRRARLGRRLSGLSCTKETSSGARSRLAEESSTSAKETACRWLLTSLLLLSCGLLAKQRATGAGCVVVVAEETAGRRLSCIVGGLTEAAKCTRAGRTSSVVVAKQASGGFWCRASEQTSSSGLVLLLLVVLTEQ
jgi:hypothetical protein